MSVKGIWSTVPAPGIAANTFESLGVRVDEIVLLTRSGSKVEGVLTNGKAFVLESPDPTAAEATFRDILGGMKKTI